MDEAMTSTLAAPRTELDLSGLIALEQARVRAFVRRRVADAADVEDIVQEVFYELVLAARLMQPVERVARWLVRVARNRVIDRLRARSRASAEAARAAPDESEALALPPAEGPEGQYARSLVMQALEAALAELPREQREAFLAHELEGRSFRELSQAWGVGINTLLGRKHAAVRHLRRRLEALHGELEEGT
jgi:RNA polymerase sigma factor (sigma-70 family)